MSSKLKPSEETVRKVQAVLRHPMQRLPSPSRGASAFIHVLGLASFAYSFNYLVANPTEINAAHGWHFQYLTIVGLALATLTFVVALLADLTLSSKLFFAKNILLVASAPIEAVITILYWGLSAIDPQLVVAPHIPRPPLETDLSFHMVPALMLVVDLLFLSPPWTVGAGPITAISALVAVLYWVWTERNYAHNGFYPYPIFDVDPLPRAGIFAGAALVSTASALGLKWLYHQVNSPGSTVVTKERSGSVAGR